MIAYRETAVKAARETITFERTMLDKKYSIVIDLEIAEPTQAPDQVGHTDSHCARTHASLFINPNYLSSQKMGSQPKLEWSQDKEAKEKAETLRPWQIKEIKVRDQQSALDFSAARL